MELAHPKPLRCRSDWPRGTTRWSHTSDDCAAHAPVTCAMKTVRMPRHHELWAKAVTTFGDRADELSFLRSRAIDPTRESDDDARAREEAKPAIDDHRSDRSYATNGWRPAAIVVRGPEACRIAGQDRGVVSHDASRMPVALRREEAVDVVAVRVGVTGKRTLGQGLQSLAGAIGVALLFPVAILIIGLPIALAVRLVVDAVAWLTALAHS